MENKNKFSVADDLLDLISKCAKKEINKSNSIKKVSAKVVSVETNEKVEVQISEDSPIMSFYNKTGQVLKVDDYVQIYYWKSLTDGFIAYKNGAHLVNPYGVGKFANDEKNSEIFNDYTNNSIANSQYSTVTGYNNSMSNSGYSWMGGYKSITKDSPESFNCGYNNFMYNNFGGNIIGYCNRIGSNENWGTNFDFIFGINNIINSSSSIALGERNNVDVFFADTSKIYNALDYDSADTFEFENQGSDIRGESAALGYGNSSSGYSCSLGYINLADQYSTSAGNRNVSVYYSTAMNSDNIAYNNSTCFGENCESGIDLLNNNISTLLDGDKPYSSLNLNTYNYQSLINLLGYYTDFQAYRTPTARINGKTGSHCFCTGQGSIATGSCGVSIGSKNFSTNAIAMGFENYANNMSVSLGYQTVSEGAGMTAVGSGNLYNTNHKFVVGNGYHGSESNAFAVFKNGNATLQGTLSSGGADYAENWEWLDGNPNNEDRRGRFVVINNDKIEYADELSNDILGVTSAQPSILGDSDNDEWHGKYLRDIFGAFIYEDVQVPIKKSEEYIIKEETTDENGKIIPAQKGYHEVETGEYCTEKRKIINPEYDSAKTYIPRRDRKEMIPVAHMGKIVMVDDGTCEVNGYCKSTTNGIATKSITGYKVLARLDNNHVKVWFK